MMTRLGNHLRSMVDLQSAVVPLQDRRERTWQSIQPWQVKMHFTHSNKATLLRKDCLRSTGALKQVTAIVCCLFCCVSHYWSCSSIYKATQLIKYVKIDEGHTGCLKSFSCHFNTCKHFRMRSVFLSLTISANTPAITDPCHLQKTHLPPLATQEC